ncbi:uncharacterized protein LOC114360056 [Ostrinia furnacalis]|uniref:uncharacterized protein LOC114360056 n=1 Tax=Ostrinia furnacalis TaxID=93504 RepID=UPI00103F0334|nr:uncharacterized protein LOC114360056 [Ostrinia furnacalis]
MSKCNKVKNPCKICLGAVTQKTGLQCHGACDSWVHYGCLNYTPGRIKDIKAGIIKVTCPCPDCKTSMPKEYRTDEPFSCTNIECPANKPPQCGNPICPTNKGEKMNQTSGYKVPNPCPLGKCGTKDCKQHSTPNVHNKPTPQTPCAPQKQGCPMPATSSSDACIDFNRCPSGCSSANVSGDMRQNNNSNMEAMPSMYTMEQMCNTVGLLSKQINELMSKMQQASRAASGKGGCCPPPNSKGGCTQTGPKALCPKPCFCPDNPGYRK